MSTPVHDVRHLTTARPRSIALCVRPRAPGAPGPGGGVNDGCHTYTGGVVGASSLDVMSRPKVVPIYWGDTTARASGAYRTAFDQFFCELLSSGFADRLAQYGVGVPTVLPSHVIGGTSSDVSSANVATQLTTWFGNGSVPIPDPISDANNWLYVLFTPPNASIEFPGACGYHSNSTFTIDGNHVDLAWALIAYPQPGAGAQGADVVNSVSYCVGHEMVEAFTNPRGNGYSRNVTQHGNTQNCEIGDLCETRTWTTVGRWSVETYWSNQDGTCAAGYRTDWASLGTPAGGVLGAPVVGRNRDGRLELFCVTNAGALVHKWQNAPNGAWSAWSTLSGVRLSSGPPVVASNADGRLVVFGMQSGGVPWHIEQTAPNNGWNAGASLGSPAGGIMGAVAVGRNADGRLEVFGVAQDHLLHHIWQTSAGGGWSTWGGLSAPPPGLAIGDPRVIANADGRLEVFVLARDGAVWHVWQTAVNNGWSGWASMGAPGAGIANGAPFVGRNHDGRVELFATGPNGLLYHMWQTAPNNGWSGWNALTPPLTIQLDGLAAVTNDQNGSLRVMTIGADGALWTLVQTAPNNGWSTWRFLDGAPPGQALNADQIPALGAQANGTVAAFVRAADGGVWWLVQTAPNGTWGALVTSSS